MCSSYHDFSKRPSSQYIMNLVLLFLIGRWRLGQDLLGDEREHDVLAQWIDTIDGLDRAKW